MAAAHGIGHHIAQAALRIHDGNAGRGSAAVRLRKLDGVLRGKFLEELRIRTAEGKDGLVCIAADDQQLCIGGQARDELARGGI